MKKGKAFLMDDGLFIEGEVRRRHLGYIFVPDDRIECGFSYQCLHRKDVGTILYYSAEEIRSYKGYENWEIVTGEDAEKQKFEAMFKASPESCPITGLKRCDSYMFEEGVIYLTYPAYSAYTLPEFDTEDLTFNRIKIDMDDDFSRENECLCDLSELRNHPNFEKIKEFYGITEEQIERAKAVEQGHFVWLPGQ